MQFPALKKLPIILPLEDYANPQHSSTFLLILLFFWQRIFCFFAIFFLSSWFPRALIIQIINWVIPHRVPLIIQAGNNNWTINIKTGNVVCSIYILSIHSTIIDPIYVRMENIPQYTIRSPLPCLLFTTYQVFISFQFKYGYNESNLDYLIVSRYQNRRNVVAVWRENKNVNRNKANSFGRLKNTI